MDSRSGVPGTKRLKEWKLADYEDKSITVVVWRMEEVY
jgi:hypothetical protein